MSLTDASGPDAPTAVATGDALDLAEIECSDLAPVLAKHVREFEPGSLVRVLTARASAMEGIRSWCRLTNNALEGETPRGDAVEFLIRRKSPLT